MSHPPAYGLWSLVALNSAVFVLFAFSFAKPRGARDWRSFGAFSAFLVALFAEMYGFPLTLYLLSGWLARRHPDLDLFSHESGHLWHTLLGWKGNPHLDPFHVASYVLIGGDIKHSEVPVSATVGYSFQRLTGFSPFVRAGIVHHFVDGDQYNSSSPGPLVAVGIDFTHVIVEASWDDSEVDFDKLNCNASGASCSLGDTTLNTYEFLLGVYWRFR